MIMTNQADHLVTDPTGNPTNVHTFTKPPPFAIIAPKAQP